MTFLMYRSPECHCVRGDFFLTVYETKGLFLHFCFEAQPHLHSSNWPQTTDLPTSASFMLGLRACAMPSSVSRSSESPVNCSKSCILLKIVFLFGAWSTQASKVLFGKRSFSHALASSLILTNTNTLTFLLVGQGPWYSLESTSQLIFTTMYLLVTMSYICQLIFIFITLFTLLHHNNLSY